MDGFTNIVNSFQPLNNFLKSSILDVLRSSEYISAHHIQLTHLFPMHPFSTHWKHQKTFRFSHVFWGRERVHWEKNGLTQFPWIIGKVNASDFKIKLTYTETSQPTILVETCQWVTHGWSIENLSWRTP